MNKSSVFNEDDEKQSGRKGFSHLTFSSIDILIVFFLKQGTQHLFQVTGTH